MDKKKVFKVSDNTYKFDWHNFMCVNGAYINKTKYVESNIEFPQNIINIDVSYGILHKLNNVYYLILGNSFDNNKAVRCQDPVYREYHVSLEMTDIFLILQKNNMFEDFYNEIMYDENEETKEYDEVCNVTFDDPILDLMLGDNLIYYNYENKDKVKLSFLKYELIKLKSKTHDVHSNTHLILNYNNNVYYYAEFQNYNICCGGGDFSYFQVASYDEMIEFDFWADR